MVGDFSKIKNNMSIIGKMEEYFKNTPHEKIKQDWEDTKEFDNVGPTMDEFLQVNNKLTTEPIVFELTILRIDKEIPKEIEKDLKEWLLSKASELGCGKHYEYYEYTENVNDAIPILFTIYKK